MSEVLQANIFFLIASLATIVFCILTSLILFQCYKIAIAVRSILERIERASELVSEDVTRVRELVESGGIFASILNFMLGSTKSSTKTKRRTRSSD